MRLEGIFSQAQYLGGLPGALKGLREPSLSQGLDYRIHRQGFLPKWDKGLERHCQHRRSREAELGVDRARVPLSLDDCLRKRSIRRYSLRCGLRVGRGPNHPHYRHSFGRLR